MLWTVGNVRRLQNGGREAQVYTRYASGTRRTTSLFSRRGSEIEGASATVSGRGALHNWNCTMKTKCEGAIFVFCGVSFLRVSFHLLGIKSEILPEGCESKRFQRNRFSNVQHASRHLNGRQPSIFTYQKPLHKLDFSSKKIPLNTAIVVRESSSIEVYALHCIKTCLHTV